MRRAAIILAWLALPQPLWGQEAVILQGGFLFDPVTLDVTRNAGILMRGGKFLEVNAAPGDGELKGARLIQLQDNEYIVPGLFDLHAHFNVNLFGRGRHDEYRVNPVVFLANGVTSTFPAGEFDPTRMLEARKRINSGKQVGCRIFNSGPYFGSARPGWKRETTPRQIQREVDFWAALGVRGFKAKGINAVQLRALIERAHLHGLTVTGHLGSGFQDSVNPKQAILMGIDRVEHFLGGDALGPHRSAYDSLVEVASGTPEFKEIVDLFIRHHVFFDATLTAYGYYGERKEVYDYWVDERRFFTPYVQEAVKNRPPRRVNEQFEKIYWVKRKTVKAFYDAGGQITLGTDHPSSGEFLSGFAAHRELEALVLSGIPPAAALRIGTLNGARALGLGDQLGSVEPGKLADLFVVMGNPLEEIRNTRKIRWVVKSGQVYDPGQLLDSVRGTMGPRTPREAEAW